MRHLIGNVEVSLKERIGEWAAFLFPVVRLTYYGRKGSVVVQIIATVMRHYRAYVR